MSEVREKLAAAGIRGEGWNNDHELCRWMRARKFDVPKVVLMIQNHVAWEKSYNVEHVYRTFAHKQPAEVKQAYPRVYHRTDRVGRPINIDCVGRLDIKRVNAVTNDEEMELEKIQEMEHTLRVKYPACSAAAGRPINQSLVIMDLSGLSLAMWNGQTRAMIKRLTGVLSDHYPETMGALFIVNAPGFFAAIWSIVKLFLDPGTVQKISILSSNYKVELFKHIDPANLPAFLGGSDASFDFMHDQGPWLSRPVTARGSAVASELPKRRRRGLSLMACCGSRDVRQTELL